MAESTTLYEFGPFCLNPTDCLLLCDGQPVALQDKAFELLKYFVEKSVETPHHLFRKDELLAQVWLGEIVHEANLANNIVVLRKVLGGHPDKSEFIKTVPKKEIAQNAVLTYMTKGVSANKA